MSSYARVQTIIEEIRDRIYPEIELHFYQLNKLRKSMADADRLERAFDIFDTLRREVLSLKNYELKLVFPGIRRFFGEKDAAIPQYMRINELHELLKKKEACVKDNILELELELDEETENPFGDMTSFFKNEYFSKKEAFYKCIAKLQKEQAVKCSDKDILEPDSLPL